MKLILYVHHPEVSAWRFSEQQAERIRKKFPHWTVSRVEREADFLAALPEAEGVVVWAFEQAWLDRAPRLRMLASPAAGFEHFPAPRAGLRMIRGHFHGELMAETAMGMLLSVCRNLDGWSRSGHEAVWPIGEVTGPMRRLGGSRVVICGWGGIAQALAKRLLPFGVQLSVIRKQEAWAADSEEIRWFTGSQADAENVWQQADHLVLLLPGGEDTRNFLSMERIASLNSRAWVYNLGRGSCIDEQAMIASLKAGRIGGAFLDVFSSEPLASDSELRKLPNVRLLPHCSAAGQEYLHLFLDELIPALEKMQAS